MIAANTVRPSPPFPGLNAWTIKVLVENRKKMPANAERGLLRYLNLEGPIPMSVTGGPQLSLGSYAGTVALRRVLVHRVASYAVFRAWVRLGVAFPSHYSLAEAPLGGNGDLDRAGTAADTGRPIPADASSSVPRCPV